MLKLILIVCILFGGYKYISQHPSLIRSMPAVTSPSIASAPAQNAPDTTGFFALPAGNNPYPGVVAIGIPPGCPRVEAQYGRTLEAALQARNIPVREIDQVSFHFSNQQEAAQIQNLMSQQPRPHVFINGHLLGHPTLDQIMREASQQGISAH